jgi:hypothetical protein
MNEITKAQMLEALNDAITTWRDGAFYGADSVPVWEAIRSLIESSGEKENKEPGAGPRIFPSVGQNPTLGGPSPGPSATPTIIIPVDKYFFVRDGEKTALYEKRDDGQPGNLICEIPPAVLHLFRILES